MTSGDRKTNSFGKLERNRVHEYSSNQPIRKEWTERKRSIQPIACVCLLAELRRLSFGSRFVN